MEGEVGCACAIWRDCCAPAPVAPSAADTPLAAPSAVMSCRNRRRLADLSMTDLLSIPSHHPWRLRIVANPPKGRNRRGRFVVVHFPNSGLDSGKQSFDRED